MGTRWRGMLAPINKPTGDGRRMRTDAFRSRPLPLGLKWQREDDMGHDASVVIGLMDQLAIGLTVSEAVTEGWISQELVDKLQMDPADEGVWAKGEMFDDRPDLPRLAEDVAEAILLTDKKVIGPSVDAGAAETIFVEAGTDEPLTDERFDELFEKAMETGEEPPIEMLFTDYEIAAATLVAIPAFVEARPFELLPAEDVLVEPVEGEPVEAGAATAAPASPALVAALTASVRAYPADVFDRPEGLTLSPVAVTDRGEGFQRIAGYVAAHSVCHLEFRDVCITPPNSASGYVPFHRYPIDVEGDNMLAVGRITTGHGQVGTGCTCCRGKDDHACSQFSLARTLDHYDQMRTLAWVRAGEDEHGIWVAGVLAPDLSDTDRAVLNRRKVSGDWRDLAGNLELVEVLALARERPGFPIPATSIRNGRQFSLVAAGVVRPDEPAPAGPKPAWAGLRDGSLARDIASQVTQLLPQALREQGLTVTPAAAVTAADGEHTGAMIALRMTDDDAARLAMDGGEPADNLHLTLMYLGEAADLTDEMRQNIISSAQQTADMFGPFEAEAFSVDVFNPESDERDTAIVLGISGGQVADVHDDMRLRVPENLEAMLGEDAQAALPEQHSPFVAHVTLAYSDDLSLVEQLTDRTNQPVTFDRIRVAFAGETIDIPLTGPVEQEEGESLASQAALLAAEVDAALEAVAADDRAREAAHLLAELEVA